MTPKTTAFIVEIVSSNEVAGPHEEDEMAQKIANAIVNFDREFGIQPTDSGLTTEVVYVRAWYTNRQIIEHP